MNLSLTGSLHGAYVDFAFGSTSELQDSVLQGKQGVIRTSTYVVSWVDMRASLTHYDIAYGYLFTGKALDAKSFSLGVASVSG